jgi:hypothetical protein
MKEQGEQPAGDVVIECAHVVMSGQQTPLPPVPLPLSPLRIALTCDRQIASPLQLLRRGSRAVSLRFEAVGSATTKRAGSECEGKNYGAKRPRVRTI